MSGAATPQRHPPQARAQAVAELINALARHQGAGSGVPAQVLAAQLGVPTRALRRLISAARDDGIAICGHPTTGYFMPTSAEELERACAFLHARALKTLRLLSRMRRIALPVLLGQLLINA